MLTRALRPILGLLIATVFVTGCDRMQLLAPTNSSVTVTAPATVLPVGGTTEVTAVVLESAGTPVQNGTTVRFTTTLGRVDPVEVQTRNGMAVTTFYAGDASGTATISARSGAAGGGTSGTGTGTGTGTTSGATSSVNILVGAAAVETVTVLANPASVSKNGGTVDVVATVMGAGGRALPGVPVTFSTTAGTLNPPQATTDANGQASTRLTTTAAATVTASAAGKTGTAAVAVTDPPAVTISCAIGTSTTAGCINLVAGQTAAITVQRATTSSPLRSATLDFGDGSAAVNLGTLSSAVTIPHVYNDPGSYTLTVTATDVNGESVTTTQFVQVLAQASGTLSVDFSDRRATATASIDGGRVLSYEWTFDTGVTFTTTTNTATYTYAASATGTSKVITVKATLADGRTLTVSTVVVVP